MLKQIKEFSFRHFGFDMCHFRKLFIFCFIQMDNLQV